MKFIYLFTLLILGLAKAQTHRFIYEYKFKMDSASLEKRNANMVLDINPEDIKFYNYEFVKIDSINKTRGENSAMWDDTPVVVRKKNSDMNSNYVLVNNLFIIDTNDKINWTLSNETKSLGGYTLQKAIAKWGGRNWTAWFTKEINLNEGPYKFRGLPGLIFELYDDKDNFSFSLIKSYKLNNTYETRGFLENFAGQKPVKITEPKLKKMMLENYNDPLHDFKEHYKKNTDPSAHFMVMGIEVKSPEQLKELSDMMQKNIKKNNNPIELDKAIKY